MKNKSLIQMAGRVNEAWGMAIYNYVTFNMSQDEFKKMLTELVDIGMIEECVLHILMKYVKHTVCEDISIEEYQRLSDKIDKINTYIKDNNLNEEQVKELNSIL